MLLQITGRSHVESPCTSNLLTISQLITNLFCVVESSIAENFCVYEYKDHTYVCDSAFKNR